MWEFDVLQVLVRKSYSDPLCFGFFRGRLWCRGQHLLLMGGPPGLGTSLRAPLGWGGEVNNVDDAFWLAVLVVSVSPWRSVGTSAFLLDVIPEVPLLDEVLQVGFVAPALVGSLPVLLVVCTELTLVPRGGVSCHRPRPLEERLRFYFIEEPIDWLLKDGIYCYVGGHLVA